MADCDSARDSSTSCLIHSPSTGECDSPTRDSRGDSIYVNCGHTGSTDSIPQSGEGGNSTDDAAGVANTNQDQTALRDGDSPAPESVERLHFASSNDDRGTLEGSSHSAEASCNHEFHSSQEGLVESSHNVVVSNGCPGSDGHSLSGQDGWRVGCAEIVCDYHSVCDNESVTSEVLTASSRDDDHAQLLRHKAITCTNSNSSIGCSEKSTHHDKHTKDSVSVRVVSPRRSQQACPIVEGPGEVTVMSTVVDDLTLSALEHDLTLSALEHDLTLSALEQIPEMPYNHLPPVAQWLADLPQPPLTNCVSTPPFTLLPPFMQPEAPSLQMRPIFYICSDQKPPLEQEESCAIDMSILQRSEVSNVAHHFTERCDSQLSTLSEKQDICRICHCEGEPLNKLISPCLCSGSLKYIHLSCLQKWIKSSDKKSCELCNFDYIMTMKTRPFKEWERLDMAMAERRKIVCSVTFHVIAITCVIWSLYVLIDRTSEEVISGALDWPFWTKLIVVAIGFTGGLVFMYVQVKMYLQLCLRWRQYNKLISIENAPEDPQLRAEAAARIKARSGENGGIVNAVALQEVESF